jgi:hypothetical protein
MTDAPSTPPDQSALPGAAHATLVAVLDCLIPPDPDRGLPGAGALGLARYVEERLGDAVGALVPGLAALDAAAAGHGATGFAALAPRDRHAVLEAHAATDPGFVPGLVFHVYAGYYQSAEVLEALGMEGRPPHPLGYEIGPSDPGLLDPVRSRPKLYRAV